MTNEELLLTPEEIRAIPFYKLTPEDALPYTILDKQLAKADPLIRKDERERIIGIINDLNSIGYPYGADYKAVILQVLGEK